MIEGMPLAHAASPGGVPLELLLVAGALLVLGVVFYLQSSVKPFVSLILIAAGIAIGTGSFALSDGDGGSSHDHPVVSVVSPQEGQEVSAGEPLTVEAQVEGDDGSGHIHIFVNGAMAAMADGMTGEVTLDPGRHMIMVEYVGADHASYADRIVDEVGVTAR
jgi:hypothetical protein